MSKFKGIKLIKHLVSLCLILSLVACTYSIKDESHYSVNVNGKNVLDVKAGIDTDNPNILYTDVNSSEYQKMNYGSQNGKPISWYIVSEDDDYKILFSEKVLDTFPYNDTNKDIKWEDTTLYDYLNTDFINIHFSKEEIDNMAFTNDVDNDLITMASLDNLIDLYGDMNYLYDGFYGDTEYFAANKKIIAKPAEAAINNDIDIFDNSVFAEIMMTDVDSRYDYANGYSPYWVLNQVEGESRAYYVTATGYIGNADLNQPYIGIRPIIRIKK